MGNAVFIAPRTPGKWIQVTGPFAGQPTPEFYRFIASLVGSNNNIAGVITQLLEAGEALQLGAVVNIGPTGAARNANGSVYNLDAHGFVAKSANAGDSTTVYFAGLVTGVSAVLTPGYVYLGLKPGTVSSTAPTQTGQTVQRVGVAISSSSFIFMPELSTQL